jgi:hypothetical protein
MRLLLILKMPLPNPQAKVDRPELSCTLMKLERHRDHSDDDGSTRTTLHRTSLLVFGLTIVIL